MSKKVLPKSLIVSIVFFMILGAVGCSFSSRRGPINKDDAVFTVEEVLVNGWGSGAASKDNDLTVEKMLRYALEDEYIKRTRYEMISEKFKIEEPFYTLSKTETSSMLRLISLFSKYNVPVPEDKSIEYIKMPKTLLEGYTLSVKGEENNIAMYERFIEDNALNEDVKEIFSKLRDVSKENKDVLYKELRKLNS